MIKILKKRKKKKAVTLVEEGSGADSVGGARNPAREKQDYTSERIFTSGGSVSFHEKLVDTGGIEIKTKVNRRFFLSLSKTLDWAKELRLEGATNDHLGSPFSTTQLLFCGLHEVTHGG